MHRLARLLGVLSLPALAAAQKTVVLARPDAEHPEPFSVISGVRELAGGRVIVADSREKLVQVIDFTGSAVKVGREGTGPGEYGLPNAIAPLPGDSTAVWDGGNRRYMLLGPDAKPVREFRLEPPGGLGRAGYGAFAATFPRGVDARGNIYFDGSPFIATPDGPVPADSVPVIRFDRARQRPETIAHVRPAKDAARVRPGPGGRGISITNGLVNPLVPVDSWTPLPDGRVAVLRGDVYRMDLYEAGKATRGTPVAHERLRVDGAMKRMLEAERKQMIAGGSSRARPDGAGAGPPPGLTPEQYRELMNLEPWPEFAPAFLRQAAIARPAGGSPQVWVLRTRRAATDSTRYDVLDLTGRLTVRVQLAPGARVVAFGRGVAYVIRTDADDLQYLARYSLAGLDR